MVRVYWKAVMWNLLVIVLSLIPAKNISDENFNWIPFQDKVIHLIMYAVLTFLILRRNHVLFSKVRKIILLTTTVLYVFLVGFFLEILQNCFLIGRKFDIFDVIANTAGIIVAVVFYKIFNH